MKFDAIKKRGDQWVRIRPALQVYSDSAVLTQQAVEDAWWLSDITEEGVKLQSRDTQHFRRLGLDHIHHYMDDPDPNSGGTTGILVLNVQLLLFEGNLLAEPVLRPGVPLEKFVPARSHETLYSTAARAASAQALAERRKEYAWNEGVPDAQNAFRALEPAFKGLETDLAARGTPVPIRIVPGGPWAFLMAACGWFVTCTWQRNAANVIEDALLTFRKYDHPPRWPNITSFEQARQLGVDQYRWGLVNLDEGRWIENGAPDRSYTTDELAAKVLTELLERANN